MTSIHYRIAVLLTTLVGACGYPPPTLAPNPAATVTLPTASELAAEQVLEGSFLVTFRSDLPGNLLQFPNYRAEYRTHYSFLQDRYLSDPRVKDIQFLTAIDLRQAKTAQDDLASPPLKLAWSGTGKEPLVGSVARVDFADTASALSLLSEWENQGAIWFAEPNYVSRLSQDENLFKKFATNYGALDDWWLTAINLAPAFEAIAQRDLAQPDTPTDQQMLENQPIIAVLDSGVDYEHPALKDHIWVNTDINAANCDNDLHGCNTTAARRGKLGNGDVWPFDTSGPGESCAGKDSNCSHGTHVAGIIAGDQTWKSPYGNAVAGVCPVCRIMILKIVSKVGKDSGILDSSIVAAFKYVTLFEREGSSAVRVINASFGKFVRSRAVGLLIRLMRDKRGTLLVGAAGNEDTLRMEYPAAFADSIAVAAVDSRLLKVSFSNFGRWVDIAAPGSGIVSSVPGGGAEAKSGTSMATPMVAGVAGLMLTRYPNISFDELRSLILTGADPKFYNPDFEGGFNFQYYYPDIPQENIRQPLLGYGLLNAQSAINRTPSDGLPIFNQLDRVKPGCSRVPYADAHTSLFDLLAFVALPLALMCWRFKAYK